MVIVGIEGGIFGAALEEFNLAATVLGLERGIIVHSYPYRPQRSVHP